MANTDNAHEASASAVGYLFQCRYALYAGLRAIPNDPQLEISIEKFDDVGFEILRASPPNLSKPNITSRNRAISRTRALTSGRHF